MNTKEAYKQKIQAQLELVEANLEVLKAKTKNASADIQINYAKEIEILENNYNIAKSKLNELGNVGDGVWNISKKILKKVGIQLEHMQKNS